MSTTPKETSPEAEYKTASEAGGSSFSVSASLEKWFLKVKLLLVFQNDPEFASKWSEIDSSSGKIEELKLIMDSSDSSQSDKNKKISELLGIQKTWEDKEVEARKSDLKDILTEKQVQSLGWGDSLNSIEDKIRRATSVENPELEKNLKQLEKLLSGELRNFGSDENFLVIERRMQRLKTELEIAGIRAGMKQELVGESKELGLIAETLKDSSDTRLLKVRNGDLKLEASLKKVVDKVVELEGDPTKWKSMKTSEILEYWEEIVDLQVKQHSGLDAGKLVVTKEHNQRAELGFVLDMMNLSFREKLAERMVKKWTKNDPTKKWDHVASLSLDNVLETKRTKRSRKYTLNGKDAVEKLSNLSIEVESLARKLLNKSRDTSVGASGSKAVDLEADIARESKDKIWSSIQAQVEKNIKNCKYNIFDDPNFAGDLAGGKRGIKRILDRAKTMGTIDDEAEFIKSIEGIGEIFNREGGGGGRRGENDPMAEFDKELWKELMEMMNVGDYGAAGSVLLDYFGRAQIKEQTNDMTMMYILRYFSVKAGNECPDYTDQWSKLRQLSYMPGVNGIDGETFRKIGMTLADKSMVDSILGDMGLMSGVKMIYDQGNRKGKEIVLTPAGMFSLLQDTQAQIDVLSTKPNSTQSTLWKIFLREMYGSDVEIRAGEAKGDVDPRPIMIKLPGSGSEWQKLSEIMVDVDYAKFDKNGFQKWRSDNTKELSLEQFLERQTWTMQSGLQYMWYTGRWADTLKSYQKTIMANAPKGLASSLFAMGVDYRYEYEVAAPWFIEVAHVFDNLLGAGERYKKKDMIQGNIRDRLVKAAMADGNPRHVRARSSAQDWREQKTKEGDSIGKLFARVMFIPNSAKIGGRAIEYEGRQISREMFNFVGNNLKRGVTRDEREVLGLVKTMIVQRGYFAADLPRDEQIMAHYLDYQDRKSKGLLEYEDIDEHKDHGHILDEKMRKNDEINNLIFWGGQIEGMWGVVDHLKLDETEQRLIEGMSEDDWSVFSAMNKRITGLDQEVNKDNYSHVLEMEALIDRTATGHGDDPFSMFTKYMQNDEEARKIMLKIISGSGDVKDFDELDDKMSAYLPREIRSKVLEALQIRYGEIARWGIYEIPALVSGTTSTGDIAWVSKKDSLGHEIFATDVHGSRIYHKATFVGRYDKERLNMDYIRPGHQEAIVNKLRQKQLYNKEAAEEVLERVLGTHGIFDFVKEKAKQNAARRGWSFDENKWNKWVKFNSHWTSKVTATASKLFLFEDPKYAMWTLAAELWGLTDKSFEQIFGMSITGGGGGGHKGH